MGLVLHIAVGGTNNKIARKHIHNRYKHSRWNGSFTRFLTTDKPNNFRAAIVRVVVLPLSEDSVV